MLNVIKLSYTYFAVIFYTYFVAILLDIFFTSLILKFDYKRQL